MIGAVLGAIAGSFIATLVIRWPIGTRVSAGRSRCDHCGMAIQPRALVPIVSYLALRGHAGCCGKPIAALHPALELAAAFIGAVSLGLFGIDGWDMAVFGWLLLTVGMLDARHFWLPDELTALLAVGGLILIPIDPLPTPAARLLGLVAGWGSLAAIAWLYRRMRGRDGMGGGDPKLLGAIGAWVGWAALPAVLLGASLLGIGCAVAMWLARKPVTLASRLPLGTLLAAAAWPLSIWMRLGGGLQF